MKRILAAAGLVLLLVFCVHTVMAGSILEVRAGLSGQVTWTIPPGSAVSEGDELVRISTLTGEAAAARAPQNGTVERVLVQPGSQISPGMPVVRMRTE